MQLNKTTTFKDGNASSTAEHTCALIYGVARPIINANNQLKAKPDQAGFDKRLGGLFHGVELSGKTLLVIGLGPIGLKVAEAMNVVGMNVLGYIPRVG